MIPVKTRSGRLRRDFNALSDVHSTALFHGSTIDIVPNLFRAGSAVALTLLAGACDGSLPSNSDGGRTDTAAGDVENIGAPCDPLTDAGPKQGVYNVQDLECTSRLCIKPIDYVGGVDTWPFCTARCSQDSDCAGRIRDAGNPTDKACVTGYTCGVALIHGSLCCVKLCLCMDFYGGPVSPPDACAPPTVPGDTCYNP